MPYKKLDQVATGGKDVTNEINPSERECSVFDQGVEVSKVGVVGSQALQAVK